MANSTQIMPLCYFNDRTGASGETVASWELTVVGFSYTPVFKSNINITAMLDPKCTFFLLRVKTFSLHCMCA